MNEFNFIDEMQFGDLGVIRYVSIYDKERGHMPWFVGRDLAEALGYDFAFNMYKLIDDEDKCEINPQTIENNYINCKELGNLELKTVGNAGSFLKGRTLFEPNANITRMTLINESGFYTAAILSQQSNSKKFRHWITSDVLPSIRKYGYYMTAERLAEFNADKNSMANFIKRFRHNKLIEKGIKFSEWFENNPEFIAWRDEMNEGLDEVCEYTGAKDRTSALFQVFKVIYQLNHISLDALRSKFIDEQIVKIHKLGHKVEQEDYDSFKDFDRLYCIYSDMKFRRIFSEYVIDRRFIAMGGTSGIEEANKVKTMDSLKLW